MDNPQIKERSYRIVHTMRLRNQRENRLLYEKLYSKQGLHSSYVNELNAVTREQQRIRRELSKIRKTMATTWGALPARDSSADDGDVWPPPTRMAAGLPEPKRTKRRRKANRGRPNNDMSRYDVNRSDVSRSDVNRSDVSRYDVNRSEVSRSEGSRSDVNRSDVSRYDVSRYDVNRSDVNRSDVSRSGVDGSAPSGRDPGLENNKPRLGPEPSMLPSLAGQSEDEKRAANRRAEGLVSPEGVAAKTVAYKRGNQDALREKDIDEAKSKIKKRLAGIESKSHASSSSSSSTSSSSSSGSTPTKGNVGGEKSRKSNRKPLLTPIEETIQEEVVADTKDDMPPEVENKKAFSDGDSLETAAGKKGQKKRRNSEPTAFDTNKYNPDGSVRTVHVMPDMPTRLNEARKARYIRHKEVMERERELSISEILGKKNGENSDTVTS